MEGVFVVRQSSGPDGAGVSYTNYQFLRGFSVRLFLYESIVTGGSIFKSTGLRLLSVGFRDFSECLF